VRLRFPRRAGAVALTLALAFARVPLVLAQFQMPDPKEMSGIPRPVDDLPAGSVSVRLIRGEMSNNIAGHPVELHIGTDVRTVNTDADGRAQFDKLPAGSTVKAVATVDGERLESQEFPAPSQGGIRLLLVATDKEKEARKAAQAAAPAVPGDVTIGGESRIVIEPDDEALSIFYILEIVNLQTSPVNPKTPLEFDTPGTAKVLEGSSPLASASGRHVVVSGPFPPGKTTVEVATTMPITGGSMTIQQPFSAPLESLLVIVKKTANELRLVSPQIARQQESAIQGTTVIVGAGDAIAAGQPVNLELTGLPHRNPAPRRIALTLATLVLLAGAWAARHSPDEARLGEERKRLVARREKLLQDLVRLENDHRKGRVDDGRFAVRREDLIDALENVYGALDTDVPAVHPGSGASLGSLGAS
jgi:hypothetical protein